MKHLRIFIAAFACLCLNGCNSVPSDCKQVAIRVLKSSYADAPKKGGIYVNLIILHKTGEYYVSNWIGQTIPIYNIYAATIDGKGTVDVSWWIKSPKTYEFHKEKGTKLTPGRYPQPDMKNASGIVCNLQVSDTTKKSEGWEIIYQEYYDALISVFGNDYSIKKK